MNSPHDGCGDTESQKQANFSRDQRPHRKFDRFSKLYVDHQLNWSWRQVLTTSEMAARANLKIDSELIDAFTKGHDGSLRYIQVRLLPCFVLPFLCYRAPGLLGFT